MLFGLRHVPVHAYPGATAFAQFSDTEELYSFLDGWAAKGDRHAPSGKAA